MPTTYTVVQYVPDPIADERLNVGVIAVSGEHARSRFLTNWLRAERFGNASVRVLKDFARQVERAEIPALPIHEAGEHLELSEAKLRELAGHWVNSIQFTTPRTSLLEPDDVIDQLATRFLHEATPAARGFRDRRAAARVAVLSVKQALADRVGVRGARELVQRRHALAGQLDTHVLDAVVGNGRALLGAQGISFEVPEVKRIEPTLEATAWAVDDIRKRDADIPLGVVALAPRPDMLAYDVRRNAFERAQRIFDGLHADLVTEDDAARWAGQAVAGIGHLL